MRCWIALLLLSLVGVTSLAVSPGLAHAQPVDPELCKTPEGRQQILAGRPATEIQDIGFQELAMAAQEGREPDVEGWKLEWVEDLCDTGPRGEGPSFAFDFDLSTMPVADPARPGTSISRFGDRLWAECNIDYDEDCELSLEPLVIPDYWTLQACRLEFDIAKRGKKVGYTVTPTAPITDEAGRTRRFRGFAVAISAEGQHTILDQKGAKIRLSNFRFVMAPMDASDDDRRNLACVFYPEPPRPPEPRPIPAPLPRPTRPEFREAWADEGRSYRFYLINTGPVTSVVEYRVHLRIGGVDRIEGSGRRAIAPNTTWASDGYHTWDTGASWSTEFILVE